MFCAPWLLGGERAICQEKEGRIRRSARQKNFPSFAVVAWQTPMGVRFDSNRLWLAGVCGSGIPD